MQILIVEDDVRLARALAHILEENGYGTDVVHNGADGLAYAESGIYDVVILDVMLPKMDGFTVVAELRRKNVSTPVLLLTARDAVPDKITGLDSGADDYMTKPFALPELEARLLALGARAQRSSQAPTLCVHDLHFNPQTLEARRADQPLHLYPAGRKLLELLMRASPVPVARERLEQALWGDAPPDGDMLRSHIYELRRAIDGPFAVKLLHTVPRVGYRLAPPAEESPQ